VEGSRTKKEKMNPSVKLLNDQLAATAAFRGKSQRYNFSIMKSALLSFIILITVIPGLFGQTKDSLIQEAISNHPRIASYNHQVTAVNYEARLQREWIDPQIQAGVGIIPVETRVGPQILRIGVRQQIPWRGKLDAAYNSVQSGANVLKADRRLSELEIAYQVKNLYYSLAVIQRQMEILTEFAATVEEVIDEQLRQIESGRARSSNVLLAERELIQVEQNINQLKNQRQAIYSELAYWIGSDNVDTIAVENEFDERSPNWLTEQAEFAEHPALIKVDADIETLKFQQELNYWNNLPQIHIGLDYIINKARSDVEIPDNGKNALMPAISFNVPIFNNRKKIGDQKLEVSMRAKEEQKRDRYNRLNSELSASQAKWKEAMDDYDSFMEQLEMTEEIVEQLAWQISIGQSGFIDYWNYQLEILRFELELVGALEKMQRQNYAIDKLLNKW
jgi:outer membrane protein, heavy metal efflux system